jgi:hypothetical protein
LLWYTSRHGFKESEWWWRSERLVVELRLPVKEMGSVLIRASAYERMLIAQRRTKSDLKMGYTALGLSGQVTGVRCILPLVKSGDGATLEAFTGKFRTLIGLASK